MSPKMMLIRILLMAFDVVVGNELFTATTLSSVRDTISLQCHHGFEGRSRLELANSCSSEASCRAMIVRDLGNTSFCSCPTEIRWQRFSNYDLSTLLIRRLIEPLPGTPSIHLIKTSWLCYSYPLDTFSIMFNIIFIILVIIVIAWSSSSSP